MSHSTWKDSNGLPCPSVTEVVGLYTSTEMLTLRGDIGNKRFDDVMAKAAATGTRVHEIIEDIMDRRQPTGASFEGERESFLADQALSWVKDNVEEILAQERGLFSNRYRYGGTCDLVARVKGFDNPILVDWKTTSLTYPTMGIQLAAYAQLFNECVGYERDGVTVGDVCEGLIFRLDKYKGGPPEITVFKNLPAYFKAFEGLRVLWDIVHGLGEFADGGAKVS